MVVMDLNSTVLAGEILRFNDATPCPNVRAIPFVDLKELFAKANETKSGRPTRRDCSDLGTRKRAPLQAARLLQICLSGGYS